MHASFSVRLRDERGVALIVALMSMMLMMALGTALVLTTMTEIAISANYREGTEALYAAEAAVERVMPDLLTVPDWNAVLMGVTTSAFTDGPPSGTRTVGSTTLDLAQTTNMVRCGQASACSNLDIEAVTEERPWGANNPRWQLYGYGPLENLLPTGALRSRMYVVVWVADDPSENDDNPLRDGGPPAIPDGENPGRGVLAILGHAYGPGDVRRVVAATVARTDATGVGPARLRVLSWREVR